MKKLLLLFTAIFCLATSSLQAQDPMYSQFFSNKPLFNSAFTGATTGPRVTANFRAQWVFIPGAFKTFAATFDMPLEIGKTTHGVGVTFMNDIAGIGNLMYNTVNVNYAFAIKFSEYHQLRFGISAGVQMANIDFFALRFPDQVSRQLANPTVNPGPTEEFLRGLPDNFRVVENINAGVVWYNKYFFAGFNANNITQPQQDFIPGGSISTKQPIRLGGFAGAKIPLDKDLEGKIAISPVVMAQWQDPFIQVNAGTYFYFEPLVVGVYYRALNNDAIIGIIGFQKGMLSVGYSYDYTLSDLTNSVSGGSHEVSLAITFPGIKRKARSPKVNMSCPKF